MSSRMQNGEKPETKPGRGQSEGHQRNSVPRSICVAFHFPLPKWKLGYRGVSGLHFRDPSIQQGSPQPPLALHRHF
ncbi:rCG47424 [Rattus norvegicus]|uniref:RCG47424 n=1 Tax=Rattus norvegicus TaxID=10116 RepID=A6HX48_RAT|nr:rCG47424 [Rattus norvegicus]